MKKKLLNITGNGVRAVRMLKRSEKLLDEETRKVNTAPTFNRSERQQAEL